METVDQIKSKNIASLHRRDVKGLIDLINFSEKHTDLEMLEIIRKHILAMRADVYQLMKSRRT